MSTFEEIVPKPETVTPQSNKKRSRKKNFLTNAKGFGKKGYYGRGTEIEEDHFTYFINILDSMKSGFETVEDKIIMANNVLAQTVDKEIHLSSNQVVSKAIEALVSFCSEEHFERYMNVFSNDYRPICADKFASHVLQKLVEIAFLRSFKPGDDEEPSAKLKKVDPLSEKEYNKKTKFPKDHRKKCSEFVLKTGKFLLNNLEDFIWDPYGSHVMRTCVVSLSGIHMWKVPFQHDTEKIEYERLNDVPDEWIDVVKEYVRRLQMWPQFPDLPYSELSSGLLQSICVGLKKIDKSTLKHFGKKILHESFLKVDNNDDKKIEIKDEEIVNGDGKPEPEIRVAKVFHRASSIRLLETLLVTAGAKLFTQLNAMLFTGRLVPLASDKATNFAVQKLIDNVKERVEFESIFDELSEHFEEVIATKFTGVIAAIAKTCVRLQTRQGAFVNCLQKALHTGETKDSTTAAINCIVKMKPYEAAVEDKSQHINLHGSLILQNMLHFNKPIKLVNWLTEMPANELADMFSSPNGSYVADAFLESKFIGEKSREKLIRYLEGNYIDMAITKFGSRVVEKLFDHANDAGKSKIIKELSEKMNKLNSTMFGRVLSHKYRVDTYRLSPQQWKAAYERANKAEKLFKDIV